MIDIELFVDSLCGLTKQNQSAYADGKQLTAAINNSSMELAQYLYSIFELNQNAVDLALPVTVAFEATSLPSGLLSYPPDYNHLLSLRHKKSETEIVKCQRVTLGQLGIISKIPHRRPNAAKNRLIYYFIDQGIQVLPKQAFNFVGIYAKYPARANIEYLYTLADGQPARTVNQAAKINIPWNKNCFNLLLYMVMDKLGFSGRELMMNEYAKLGIQKEDVKPKN